MLDEALRLWRGPAFGEFAFAEFVRAEAARLDELRWTAIEERVDARLTLGAHEELVGELEALVRESAFRERLWGELMLALYRSGRQAEALRTYARVRTVLGEELGIEPGAALRELEEAMLLQKTELDWTPPGARGPPSLASVPVESALPPSGTVTFLFTDLEGSTRLWEEHADAMTSALARHDQILRTAVEVHAGFVVKTTGDGLHAAFPTAPDALRAALEAQRALVAEQWAVPGGLQVRMGVHTGSADYRDGDYFGTAVNRATRVMAAAHGGQVVVSFATEELLRDSLPDDVDPDGPRASTASATSASAGALFQLVHPELVSEFPDCSRWTRSRPISRHRSPRSSAVTTTSQPSRARWPNRHSSRSPVSAVWARPASRSRSRRKFSRTSRMERGSASWRPRPTGSDAPGHRRCAGRAGTPGLSIEECIAEFLRTKRLSRHVGQLRAPLGPAARFAELVAAERTTGLHLATSPRGSGVDGEHIRALRSLSLPDPSADVDMLSGARRATVRRSRPGGGFLLRADASSGEAVGELCRRLDGVPLAIELAAARIVAMSPAEDSGRLDERFRLLTGGAACRGRAAPDPSRHGRLVLLAVFAAPISRVFARLGVFAGTFGASDAAKRSRPVRVSSAGMSSRRSRAWSQVDGGRRPRCRRQHEVLDARDACERTHASASTRPTTRTDGAAKSRRVLRRVRGAGRHGLGGPRRARVAARVRAELDNLRAAIGWALDSSLTTDAQLGLRIVAGSRTRPSAT